LQRAGVADHTDGVVAWVVAGRLGRPLVIAIAAVFVCLVLTHGAEPQSKSKFADLEWTFVRIQYDAWPEARTRYLRLYGMEPWRVDSPSAEWNLTARLKSVTRMVVRDPEIGLRLDDPALFEHPWIYFVEPGTWQVLPAQVQILREFFARGGTATFDDFHGPAEWDNLEKQLALIFPDRPIVELQPPHPVYSCFYNLDAYPQVPGLGSFLAGRTWEKGGYVPHLRTILDDAGRPMVFINWNTDMGDGWEWSNAEEYPGYIKHTANAYRMGINEIIYALTH
jgi:hypothetical protein